MAYKKRSGKSLDCKECGEEVKNVGEEATAVTCWKCVNKMMRKSPNVCEADGDEKREEEKEK